MSLNHFYGGSGSFALTHPLPLVCLTAEVKGGPTGLGALGVQFDQAAGLSGQVLYVAGTSGQIGVTSGGSLPSGVTGNSGDLIYTDPAGQFDALPGATSGYVLVASGTNAIPSWQVASGTFRSTTGGTGTFTLPTSAATTVRVWAMGAGGGGASANNQNSGASGTGNIGDTGYAGSGAGGGVSMGTYSIRDLTFPLTFVIGQGGSGGIGASGMGAAGQTGGDTWIGSSGATEGTALIIGAGGSAGIITNQMAPFAVGGKGTFSGGNGGSIGAPASGGAFTSGGGPLLQPIGARLPGNAGAVPLSNYLLPPAKGSTSLANPNGPAGTTRLATGQSLSISGGGAGGAFVYDSSPFPGFQYFGAGGTGGIGSGGGAGAGYILSGAPWTGTVFPGGAGGNGQIVIEYW